jgi:hypothetical protein
MKKAARGRLFLFCRHDSATAALANVVSRPDNTRVAELLLGTQEVFLSYATIKARHHEMKPWNPILMRQ